ncbi:hypothetical protein ACLOJK_038918 [Asimina triloba]
MRYFLVATVVSLHLFGRWLLKSTLAAENVRFRLQHDRIEDDGGWPEMVLACCTSDKVVGEAVVTSLQ